METILVTVYLVPVDLEISPREEDTTGRYYSSKRPAKRRHTLCHRHAASDFPNNLLGILPRKTPPLCLFFDLCRG